MGSHSGLNLDNFTWENISDGKFRMIKRESLKYTTMTAQIYSAYTFADHPTMNFVQMAR